MLKIHQSRDGVAVYLQKYVGYMTCASQSVSIHSAISKPAIKSLSNLYIRQPAKEMIFLVSLRLACTSI